MHREAWHFHGHCHFGADYNQAMFEKGIRRYDVGVDANAYFPVSFDDIKASYTTDVMSGVDLDFEKSHHTMNDLFFC